MTATLDEVLAALTAETTLDADGEPLPLVIGDRDFVRLDHAAEMLDLFPDCRLAVLPATRHPEVMQHTDELRALVGPLLR